MSASPRVGPRVRNRVGWRHRVARLGIGQVYGMLRDIGENPPAGRRRHVARSRPEREWQAGESD